MNSLQRGHIIPQEHPYLAEKLSVPLNRKQTAFLLVSLVPKRPRDSEQRQF